VRVTLSNHVVRAPADSVRRGDYADPGVLVVNLILARDPVQISDPVEMGCLIWPWHEVSDRDMYETPPPHIMPQVQMEILTTAGGLSIFST